MYKIRRVNVPDVFLFCRCYASRRNEPNHYETLSVQSNSSKKEIRDAFLKLSKELHPDIGGKGSHAEFVKVNEAYKILSKDYTRQQHDMDLKYQSAVQNGEANYHGGRVYHYDPVNFKSRVNQSNPDFENNYYGIKGVRRMSNWKIAAICVLVAAIIISVEMVLLKNAVRRNQKYMKLRSLEAELHYEEVKAAASSMNRDEAIEAMQKKFDTDPKRQNLGENDG